MDRVTTRSPAALAALAAVSAAAVAVATGLAPARAHAQEGGGKMVIAVQSLRYGGPGLVETKNADGSYSKSLPMTPSETGLLTDKLNVALVKSGKFKVVERAMLQKILDEQGLGDSGAVSPASAAQIGKLTGARYYLMGTISNFDAKTSFRKIPGTTKYTHFFHGLMIIDVKIVDTQTGQIIAADQARAVHEWKVGPRNSAHPAEFPAEEIDTIQRIAVREAVCKILGVLYPMKVMKASQTQVYVNRGEGGCIEKDKLYDVYSLGEELIDPDTGESLGAQETKVAVIRVTEVLAKFSKAVVVDGAWSGIAVGMICRPHTGAAPIAPPPPPADTTAPTVTIHEPTDGYMTNAGSVKVVVSATDDRGVTEVQIGGAPAQGDGSRWWANVSIPEGLSNIVARARDEAGNWGEAKVEVERDSTPPDCTILAPKDQGRYTSGAVNVGIKTTADDVESVWVNGNKAERMPDKPGWFKASLTLGDGKHTITAKARDLAGNEGATSVTIWIDSTAPEVNAKASVKVEGKVDDPSSKVTVNGKPVTVRPDGSWTIEIKLPPDKKVTIVATDSFGNETTRVLDYSK